MFGALCYLWASATTMSTTFAAPHSMTDHVNMVGREFSRIECQEGKQSMSKGQLGSIQRAEPGMGIKMPISTVDTTQTPPAALGNNPTVEISKLGRADTERRRED